MSKSNRDYKNLKGIKNTIGAPQDVSNTYSYDLMPQTNEQFHSQYSAEFYYNPRMHTQGEGSLSNLPGSNREELGKPVQFHPR